MKKICYIVTVPVTIRAFFVPQLKYLAEHGYDVTVICSYDENLQKELGESIRYTPVDIPRGISFVKSLNTIKKLIKIFEENHYDMIQYSTPNAALYASIAGKKAGIRVRNYHLMGFRYLGADGVGRVILKAIEKMTCVNSTSIECVSISNLELGITEKNF